MITEIEKIKRYMNTHDGPGSVQPSWVLNSWIKLLLAERDVAIKALEWYADNANYDWTTDSADDDFEYKPIGEDSGERARTTLAQIKGGANDER